MHNNSKYRVITTNKKASYNYFIAETYTAGIVLTGTEIKSLRNGKVSINEAFCTIHNYDVFIRQMFIARYSLANYYNHEEYRVRKLLLQKHEIRKLQNKKIKNYTIIPTEVILTQRGLAKIKISLAKGKKKYDKRQSLKEKDINRKIKTYIHGNS